MEIIYFTVAGIFLYLFSDWVLQRIETWFGRRLEYRSLIFFVIILVLSVSLFNLIQYLQRGDVESVAQSGAVVQQESGTAPVGGSE